MAFFFQLPTHNTASAQQDTAYWNNRFFQLLRWTYVDDSLVHLYLKDTVLSPQNNEHVTLNTKYIPLHWYGYSFQDSEQWPVVFTIALGDGDPQTLTLPALNQLAQWGAFLTNEDYRKLVRNQLNTQHSTQNTELNTEHSTQNTELNTAFIDSMQAVLIADSIAFANAMQQKNIAQTKKRMNRDQIFILNIKTAHSEYMFGIELNLYNCFGKTISMLEFNVAPYNAKGRVQEDQFHRTVRTMRCMGPITPGSPAQYTFDELFWDDRDRIKYMRLNSITFHFTDGTTQSFRGYEKILRHTLR